MGYVCPRGLELLRTGVISQVVRAIACFSSVTSKPSLAKSASDVLVWLAAWKSRDEERAFSPLAPLRRNSCRRVHLRSFHNPGYVQQCNMNTHDQDVTPEIVSAYCLTWLVPLRSTKRTRHALGCNQTFLFSFRH